VSAADIEYDAIMRSRTELLMAQQAGTVAAVRFAVDESWRILAEVAILPGTDQRTLRHLMDKIDAIGATL